MMKENKETIAPTAKKSAKVYGSNMSDTGINILHRLQAETPKNENQIRGVKILAEDLVDLRRKYPEAVLQSCLSAGVLVIA